VLVYTGLAADAELEGKRLIGELGYDVKVDLPATGNATLTVGVPLNP
jgi:hypothetical protein